MAYLLVMLPWFARNLAVIGTPLPVGGTATIWLRGYNEIVSYPPVDVRRELPGVGLEGTS